MTPISSNPRSARRTVAATALAALACLAVLSACSPSGGKSSANSRPSGTGIGSSSSSPSSSSATGSSAAQAIVAEYAGGKPTIAVPTLSKRPATGIKVDAVICTLPTCVSEYEAAPYKALGWNFQAYDYDLTKGPSALVTAFENAIQDHPKYIVLQAVFPTATFQAQLTAATKAGIGIVELANPGSLTPGTLGCIACLNYQERTGALQVDVAVADGGTSSHVLYVTDPAVGVLNDTTNGAKQELARLAPDNDLHVLNVSQANPPSVTAAAVASYLQQHSDTQYAIFSVAALADGVPQVLAQDGLAGKVKVITQSPLPTDLQEIAAGTQFASVAAADISTVWRCADILARDSVGETVPSDLVSPEDWHRIIDKQNVSSLNGQVPEPPNFEATFKAAWLVSS